MPKTYVLDSFSVDAFPRYVPFWRTCIHQDGRIYYFDCANNKSQWEKPDEFQEACEKSENNQTSEIDLVQDIKEKVDVSVQNIQETDFVVEDIQDVEEFVPKPEFVSENNDKDSNHGFVQEITEPVVDGDYIQEVQDKSKKICTMAQKPNVCLLWGDPRHVQIGDLSSHLNAMAVSKINISMDAIADLSPTASASDEYDTKVKDEEEASDGDEETKFEQVQDEEEEEAQIREEQPEDEQGKEKIATVTSNPNPNFAITLLLTAIDLVIDELLTFALQNTSVDRLLTLPSPFLISLSFAQPAITCGIPTVSSPICVVAPFLGRNYLNSTSFWSHSSGKPPYCNLHTHMGALDLFERVCLSEQSLIVFGQRKTCFFYFKLGIQKDGPYSIDFSGMFYDLDSHHVLDIFADLGPSAYLETIPFGFVIFIWNPGITVFVIFQAKCRKPTFSLREDVRDNKWLVIRYNK